jgi:hypothetical protein
MLFEVLPACKRLSTDLDEFRVEFIHLRTSIKHAQAIKNTVGLVYKSECSDSTFSTRRSELSQE